MKGALSSGSWEKLYRASYGRAGAWKMKRSPSSGISGPGKRLEQMGWKCSNPVAASSGGGHRDAAREGSWSQIGEV